MAYVPLVTRFIYRTAGLVSGEKTDILEIAMVELNLRQI